MNNSLFDKLSDFKKGIDLLSTGLQDFGEKHLPDYAQPLVRFAGDQTVGLASSGITIALDVAKAENGKQTASAIYAGSVEVVKIVFVKKLNLCWIFLNNQKMNQRCHYLV